VLALLGERAAAWDEDAWDGDAPRRPASIFLVMGIDSKSSSESLLLLLLKRLRFTARLGRWSSDTLA
jgi:hypothetical protein